MSTPTPVKQGYQLKGAQDICRAFNCRVAPTQAALAIFPARVSYDPHADASEVNEFLNKVKKTAGAMHRRMAIDVANVREECERPDAALKFLFTCRKNHVFMRRDEPQLVQGGQQSLPPPPVAPSSPFLRRSASRDPVHRIKEEPMSPMPLSQVNGTPVSHHYRSRSKPRSYSMSTNVVKDSPASLNDMEKATSAVNPMYFNHAMSSVRPSPNSIPPSLPRGVKPPLPPSAGMRPVEPPPYPGKPIAVRMGVPPVVPQDGLFRELRGALQGIAGMYFINDGRGSLVVSRTCSVSEANLVVMEDLLSLGNAYLELKRHCDRWNGSDVTTDALAGVVSQILDEYITDVGGIPLKSCGQRGMQALLNGVSVWRLRLDVMLRSFLPIKEDTSALLDQLYVLWKAVLGTESESVMTRILDATLGVFCNSLRSWVNYGKLINNEQWIIGGTDVGTDTDSGAYKIVRRPLFLCNISIENVLKIGTSQSLVSGNDVEKLEDFRNLVDAQVTARNLYLAGGRLKINRLLSSMADWVGRKVVDRLMNESHLLLHLKAARMYLLLDDAEFAAALFRCIQRTTSRVGMTRDEAFTAFVMAIKQAPTSTTFPFRVVIDTLASPESSPIGSARTQFMQSIHPLYRVKGLVGSVFRGAQPSYEILFHFLWSIQTALFQAEGICARMRQCHREASQSKDLRSFHRRLSAIGSRSHRILLQTREYTLATISQCSKRLHARLSEITDVESAAEHHLEFLEELQTSLFCDGENENAGQCIMRLMEMTNDLSKQAAEFEEMVLSRKENPLASQTLADFEAAELDISLDEQKNRLNMTSAKMTKATEGLFGLLRGLKDRNPFMAIILSAQ